jgi:hypothetical protein
MTCSQCGAPLQPNSGFCGACGRPVASGPPQQQGYPPPQHAGSAPPPHGSPPPGYPPPPHGNPAHAYPPPPQYPPPQHAGSAPPPHGSPPPGYALLPHGNPAHAYPPPPPGYPPPHGNPAHAYPHSAPPPGHAQPNAHGQPGGALRPFPITMQQRMTRLTGQMFVAPARLFFICESQKGGLAIAIGKSVGGLIGGAIAAFGTPTPGQAAPVLDEPTLFQAVQERPGSLVMEPAQIKEIKDTFWTHAIWFNRLTYALPDGLGKELKAELALWCQANNVKNAGLLPKK